MIYDCLENLGQYAGLYEHLDTCLAWLEEKDAAALPLGVTQLDGENVVATVLEVPLQNSDELPFAAHSRCVTLLLDLEGAEILETTQAPLTEHAPYDQATDTAYYEAAMTAACVLGPGRFAVLLAEEPYKQNVRTAGCDRVRKVVIQCRL